MSRRLNKRKRHRREEYMLSERDNVSEGALSERSLLNLSKFINKEVITGIEHVIATGKESDVFVAIAGGSDMLTDRKFVAVKIFRIEASTFFAMQDYILGDPRFTSAGKTKSETVEIWCRKEYGNLVAARDAGANVPKPYMHYKNILAMEFLGDDEGRSWPRLKDVKLSEDEAAAMEKEVSRQVGLLRAAGLVHADLSEYNILVGEGKPYIIDMAQAVSVKHPKAEIFAERDRDNMRKYFSRLVK